MGIIRESANLLNSDNKTRAEGWGWMIEDEVDVAKLINKEAKVGYFVGCMTSFKPSLDFIAQNTVRILYRIGEDFTIMGPNEFCCGFPSYLGGVDEDFIEHNVKAVTELGIETLVFTCPGCYRAFKVNYPKKLGTPLPFQVKHLSQYLCDKLDAGLTFKHQVPLRLAYHDPCDLGRHSGVYDEPRRVLKEAGVKVVELANNRENAKCCGMGGLLLLTDMEVSVAIGKGKIQEVRDAGVSGLVTACPACIDQFRRLADGIEVYEMSDIVLKAL